ncbi:MAG: ABC transporter permease [Chloroflexi bacterium]|nr:ABC transporter permease [Chloroflexota bacterium]
MESQVAQAPTLPLQRWTAGTLRKAWRFSRRNPVGAVSFALVVLLVVVAVLGDFISPHDPNTIYKGMRLADPGTVSPDGKPLILGGDELGRDFFARVILGARVSLFVSLSAIVVGTLVGATLGIMSGYIGGQFDLYTQRWMDGQQAIPTLVLALVIMVVLSGGQASLTNVVLAIGLVLVPRTNRIVRSSVLSTKENVYVEAARSIGASAKRIMFRHILPNVTAPILIIISVELGSAILIEASLSFLGFGVPAEVPSWGAMLSSSGRQYMLQEPRLLWAPGVALSLTVMAFNLAGDTLRDVWDPRLRGSV